MYSNNPSDLLILLSFDHFYACVLASIFWIMRWVSSKVLVSTTIILFLKRQHKIKNMKVVL